MKNYVSTALVANYGFEPDRDAIYTGRGSWFSGGQLVRITFAGVFATITARKWLWDQYGECVYDTTTTTTCHLSQVWGFLPDWVLTR